MESSNRKFEKSIIDLKSVLMGFRHFWWILIIGLGVSIGMVFLIDTSNKGTKEIYELGADIYVGREYENPNVPPIDNISVFITSDMVWNEVDRLLEEEGEPVTEEKEREVAGKQYGDSDFYEITLEGKEEERLVLISNKLLKVLNSTVGQLEGFSNCQVMSIDEPVKVIKDFQKGSYILIFALLVAAGIIILISMFDPIIWSDYDLKLYFGKKYLGKVCETDLVQGIFNEGAVNKLKTMSCDFIVLNAEIESIKDLNINIVSLKQFKKNGYQNKAKKGEALLIVYRGITSSNQINSLMEEFDTFNLGLFGCLMVE